MTTFGLVHGAYHGAWCWEPVVPGLERAGHRAVAPNLPCDDPDAGIDRYAATVVDALGDADDVVLVGHSLGSLFLPVIAARHPGVRRLVYLCSVPTGPGQGTHDTMGPLVVPAFLAAPRFSDAAGREVFDGATAAYWFFHDCSPADADWAVARLRPQSRRPMTETVPLASWPEVSVGIVLTDADRIIDPAPAMDSARASLGGAEPVVLGGSHSPFLSRPAELVEVLVAEAEHGA